jgi:hypothetical protein
MQNGDFNSPGTESAVLLGQGDTFVSGWANHDEFTGYIPKGQTADQDWNSGGFGGSVGPGYGIANGLVGPPSGNAQMVIDGPKVSVPPAALASSTRQSAGWFLGRHTP